MIEYGVQIILNHPPMPPEIEPWQELFATAGCTNVDVVDETDWGDTGPYWTITIVGDSDHELTEQDWHGADPAPVRLEQGVDYFTPNPFRTRAPHSFDRVLWVKDDASLRAKRIVLGNSFGETMDFVITRKALAEIEGVDAKT